MHDDRHDRDAFDSDAWADERSNAFGGDGRYDSGAGWMNGRESDQPSPPEPGDEEDEAATEEGLVASGGVIHWDEPEDASDPQAELSSPLGNEEVELPPGAPPGPRVRAVHAWLLRKREDEHAAMGNLLLAQREQRVADDTELAPRRRAQRGEPEASPLELAIAEHEGAAVEYEELLAALDEHILHAGTGRALVEYYLWLTEHLAALAAQPEAASADAPPRTPAVASWLGHAQAALAARSRVERMTAPDQDD
jgi:hypothetical protein